MKKEKTSAERNETRQRLIESAKKEFFEKGVEQASLRTICKNAGVTTGALYFFFKDKEELLMETVREPIEKVFSIIKSHFDDEDSAVAKSEYETSEANENDMEASKKIFDVIYDNYDCFVMMFNNISKGSPFEKFYDGFVEMAQKHYRLFSDEMSKKFGIKKVDDYIIHWQSHYQFGSFMQLVLHVKNKKEAMSYLPVILNSLEASFYSVCLGTEGNKKLFDTALKMMKKQ